MQLLKAIVDTQKASYRSIGAVNAYDDLQIILNINMNDVPVQFVNPIFELISKKEDGNWIRQQVNISLIENNEIEIIGDIQLVTCTGIVSNQLIIDDNGRKSTCIFHFQVRESLDRQIIQSISNVKVLEELDTYVVQAFENLRELEERIEAGDATIRKLNDDMIAAETNRENAEADRGSTFDNLVTRMNNVINVAITTDETLNNNETARINNFNTLKTELEQIREGLLNLNNSISLDEQNRVQAELDRANASIEAINRLNTINTNITNEEATRVQEWNNIKSENTTLKEALTTINNTANSNEEVRKKKEEERIAAEQQRQANFETMQQENNSFKERIDAQYEHIIQEKIVDLELDGNILKLKKSDGTIGLGVELPTSNGSDGTEEKPDESYDLEINLPFTPTSETKVQLEFSNGVAESYNTETNTNINTTDAWVVTPYNVPEYVFEQANYLGKNCLHFSKDSSTNGYCTLKSINAKSNLLDKTHKYYARVDFCLISDGANVNYPKAYGAKSFATAINTSNLNIWQSFSEIQTPTNNTNEANLRLMIDGEAYFTGLLIDLTLNNMETKTLEQLNSMYENSEFNIQGTAQFSCIVNNGSTTTTIEPFNGETITNVYKVNANDTLKITKNGNYPLPNVIAKVSSTNSDIEIQDVDFILNTRFRGKMAVFEGDSITCPTFATYYKGKSWASYVINKLKLKEDSLIPAQGGASISTFNTTNSVVTRVLNTNYPNNVKLFCVFAGTNDWGENVALGEKTSTDTSTVLGALNTIIQTIQNKCPDAEIVVICPMHRYGDTATHNGYTIYDMAKAYQEVCEINSVTFVNSLTTFGIRNYGSIEENYLLKDGLHPTEAGQKRIGVRMAGIISTL